MIDDFNPEDPNNIKKTESSDKNKTKSKKISKK